ncbi:MAG: hypothetical protein PHH60_00505 [Candidatus Margulisbacteria bacterium]|nr:hypothetical protein [Candidatus Margulisiibacteriota bacterium]
MFYNKYSSYNNIDLLKASKPRKTLTADAPDISNFITTSANLKKLANFGMSLLGFLPDFERLMFAGKMRGTEHCISHDVDDFEETWVSNEWIEAYNRHKASVADAEAWGLENIGSYDSNDDGYISNEESILWAQEDRGDSDPVNDGFESWRTDWISGVVHRTAPFERAGDVAGQDAGAYFENIDFMSNTGNCIKQKDNITADDAQALALADRAYFIDGGAYDQSFNFLDAIGADWDDVKDLMQNTLGGKSIYNIVMDRDYQDLSPRQAALFIAYAFEKRESAWQCLTDVFGPVTSTRDDEAMMAVVDSFINSNNPYVNHHALSLFPFFLEIQHSGINRLSTFYESVEGSGWEASVLDKARMWEFVQWMGGESYNNSDIDDADKTGKLYEFRNLFAEGEADEDATAYNAVNTLIDKWFGAANPENGRPVSESPGDDAEVALPDASDSGWVNISNLSVYAYNNSTSAWEEGFSAAYAYVPHVDHPAYSWDRKWVNTLYVKNSAGTVAEVNGYDAGWADIMYDLWSQGAINSRISPLVDGSGHPAYAASQTQGLMSLIAGAEFSNNWVIHAAGMFSRWGVGLDNSKMMEAWANRRVASARDSQNKKDYAERMDELQYEESALQRNALKKVAEKKTMFKKALEKAKGTKNTGKKPKTPSSNTGSGGGKSGGKTTYSNGSQSEYQKSLQKFSQRLLGGINKRKALLQKMKSGE